MQNAPLNQPLADEELDQLDALLAQIGPNSMTLEMVDGYFAALLCSPELVQPSGWLPRIWGEGYSLESEEQFTLATTLLMRHWNAVAASLRAMQDSETPYRPVVQEDDDGVILGNDWAMGFLEGIDTSPAGWDELLDSDDPENPLIPFMILAYENDPDPEMRAKEISPEEREFVLGAMIDGLEAVYNYFEPMRQAGSASREPVRRSEPKTGRNDPCSCGSGRKYKQCCGAATPTQH